MKTLRALTPIALGLLTFTVASSVNAQAVIDTIDNGNLSVTGMTRGSGCTNLFIFLCYPSLLSRYVTSTP